MEARGGIPIPAPTQPNNVEGASLLTADGGLNDTVSAAVPVAEARLFCEPMPLAAAAAAANLRYVNVNVATLWKTSHSPRALDEPSLRFPADVPAWIGPMSVRDKLALVDKTETEALYGEPVALLEERGGWARVAIPAQRTPQQAQGCPGWLPARQLADRSEAALYAGCPLAVVDKRTAWLFEDAALHKPSLQRYYGIELPRDAQDQAKAGRAVDRRGLQPGDLLFFAFDKGKGVVHHAAMYAGDGKMLHSPKTERSVELIPIATPEYAAEFAGARRFLP